MTNNEFSENTFINGEYQPNSALNPLAFSGFAHFSAMQVRGRKVRGIDLHLTRLRKASQKLFNNTLSDQQIRTYIRDAMSESPLDCSLTITLYSSHGEFTAQSMDTLPQVLVRTSAPSNGPVGPLHLTAIKHQRPMPDIKHVGEIGKTFYLHRAIEKGFDDAIFVDEQTRISEGTIWNLVFWDGYTIIWPKAPMLQGTTMSILQRQLTLLQIPQRTVELKLSDLNILRGAAVMNSWTPGITVKGIDSTVFKDSDTLNALLHKAYQYEPLQEV
ncbi:hypothetical protein N473_16970 [Pseudoalteromonas luteoviolacea CPMOR-1]|uniref:Aminotransferase class IV n=1 Tax=Pseudoalteromonas luteoviolacea CPMOR-1 TaxID=1365248 RepID=A0A162BKM3_9GAMM|nr:aminotransferase class IV family protein [Pseudoalteromonas luteoviolacea]KZN63513.1 hypothetical protein N473_16970 [Pseudoalteromonas luteoviolacea CPMOR-1]